MKLALLFIAITSLILWSCKSENERYLDLNTGEPVVLVKDSSSGLLVEKATMKPVPLYVDTRTKDTIDGRTGTVINGKVIKDEKTGVFTYSRPTEYKSPDGDLKVEVEKDGDIKIKDGDTKTKIDGKTGEKKVKHDD
jgi:hypothetical protein